MTRVFPKFPFLANPERLRVACTKLKRLIRFRNLKRIRGVILTVATSDDNIKILSHLIGDHQFAVSQYRTFIFPRFVLMSAP